MLGVYRQMVKYRRDERVRAERGLSPRALSRLTWTAEDRRAWDDTYRAAVRIFVDRQSRTPAPLAVLRAYGTRAYLNGDAICEQHAYPSAASVMGREG